MPIKQCERGFLRSGVTKECWKSRGKLKVDKERSIIFGYDEDKNRCAVFEGRPTVGLCVGSSSHCLFGRYCNRWFIFQSRMLVGKYIGDDGCGEGGESYSERFFWEWIDCGFGKQWLKRRGGYINISREGRIKRLGYWTIDGRLRKRVLSGAGSKNSDGGVGL